MDITVALDDETERWVRREAERRGESLSTFVGGIVREALSEGHDYVAAMHRYRSRPTMDLSSGAPYPSRDELHDR
jgi:hypothetical protein